MLADVFKRSHRCLTNGQKRRNLSRNEEEKANTCIATANSIQSACFMSLAWNLQNGSYEPSRIAQRDMDSWRPTNHPAGISHEI